MANEYKYDYLILGTGMSALSAGALLSNAGYKVCMLEAHDIPGGYAQSFKWGDFYFCGQVHYIWGCGPGGLINRFLTRIGLEKDITFELFDPDGYDRMAMPDGKIVKIPYGWDKLVANIESAYPGQGPPAQKFVDVLAAIRAELRSVPDRKIRWSDFLTAPFLYPNLIRYRNATVQNVFDKCELSREAQAALIANAGDYMAPPEELSIFVVVGLLGGYNTGAYYPTKHFRYYIDRIAKYISDHRGCHIFYETEVTKIETEGDCVTGVITHDGRRFTGRTIICNIDPQKASYMIGREKFPKRYLPKVSYEYSPSGVVVYLGLKDIDLKKYGFGSYNTWHLEQWDMNKMWRDQAMGDFSKPWFFISTATMHSKAPGVAPPNHEIMELATYVDYEYLEKFKKVSYEAYDQEKNRIADIMIDLMEKKYVPDIRKHIATKVIGSPSTNKDFVWAPFGNAYGSYMSPHQVGLRRLRAETPWTNFFWCNASSGFASIHGSEFR
ncbi:NAD(P)/FAD-dependent oxidoreductase [Candidatus Berkelbacteria bacterium]|nr:NAD(P)/FAD-dependent oxidoreductase [Candidatus Berkelbacteria bacterium]